MPKDRRLVVSAFVALKIEFQLPAKTSVKTRTVNSVAIGNPGKSCRWRPMSKNRSSDQLFDMKILYY
jgi:hypothetical protein